MAPPAERQRRRHLALLPRAPISKVGFYTIHLQNGLRSNYTFFFFFSQRKNYLLVGTADGTVTVYEDSVLKVSCLFIILQLHLSPYNYHIFQTKSHFFFQICAGCDL